MWPAFEAITVDNGSDCAAGRWTGPIERSVNLDFIRSGKTMKDGYIESFSAIHTASVIVSGNYFKYVLEAESHRSNSTVDLTLCDGKNPIVAKARLGL